MKNIEQIIKLADDTLEEDLVSSIDVEAMEMLVAQDPSLAFHQLFINHNKGQRFFEISIAVCPESFVYDWYEEVKDALVCQWDLQTEELCRLICGLAAGEYNTSSWKKLFYRMMDKPEYYSKQLFNLDPKRINQLEEIVNTNFEASRFVDIWEQLQKTRVDESLCPSRQRDL